MANEYMYANPIHVPSATVQSLVQNYISLVRLCRLYSVHRYTSQTYLYIHNLYLHSN